MPSETRLHPPRTGSALIERPSLIQRLKQNPKRNFTLLSAPAGFGKTTLIACWLAGLRTPVAWLSIDEFDNDPAVFLHYIAAAVQYVFPEAFAGLSRALQAPDLPTAGALAAIIIDDLSRFPEPILMVLDESGGWFRYHHLFQQMLQQKAAAQLGKTAVFALHNRAGDWFAGQGVVDEALHHYLDAGSMETAVIPHRTHQNGQKEIAGNIYRCKGIVYTAEQPQRRVILQAVGRRSDIALEEEWGEREPQTQIVAIGAPDSIDNGELTALFEACVAEVETAV